MHLQFIRLLHNLALLLFNWQPLNDAWIYIPATAQDGGVVNLHYPKLQYTGTGAEMSKYVSFPYLIWKGRIMVLWMDSLPVLTYEPTHIVYPSSVTEHHNCMPLHHCISWFCVNDKGTTNAEFWNLICIQVEQLFPAVWIQHLMKLQHIHCIICTCLTDSRLFLHYTVQLVNV